MNRALVTGATGFTGSHTVPLLIDRGYSVRCLVRASSDRSVLAGNAVEWFQGDLADPHALKLAMKGTDLLVNVASIGFGHAPDIVDAALATGVKRAVFLSTTAIFTSLKAPSIAVRIIAEDAIKNSGLAYTILRPTMIYGGSRDRNMCRLVRYLLRWPVMLIPGDGRNLQQPVYVNDVATAIVEAISTDRTIGKSYNVPGPKALTFKDSNSQFANVTDCGAIAFL
jgi:uncharacterized protein YbjT (DUF2867 family)